MILNNKIEKQYGHICRIYDTVVTRNFTMVYIVMLNIKGYNKTLNK